MPKLKADTQAARREHILDAAELCFARAGFHRTTMIDICKEASVSAGAIYGHFASKEALIAGLCERDRAMLSRDLSEFADAPDLIEALQRLGEHYTTERPRHKQILHIEIGVESTRNDEVARIFRSVDGFCRDSFESIFANAQAQGRIAPTVDIKTIAQVMSIIGDGMFWRHAVDPEFDASSLLPVVTQMIGSLINPTELPAGAENQADSDMTAQPPTTRTEPAITPATKPKPPIAGRNNPGSEAAS